MNDRELLELAAKAAGIPDLKYWGAPCIPAAWIYDYEDANTYKMWNPLTDDGDALRLAVKLQIDIRQFLQYRGRVETLVDRLGKGWGENIGNDPYAATRRAIVRAAAAIGKEK